MGIKIMIVAFLMGAAFQANAKTYYVIDGKAMSKAEAIRVTLSDPAKEVLKVQVNWTRLNPETANFKKQRDGVIKDIPR